VGTGWKRGGGVLGVVDWKDWKHRVSFIYSGQGGNVGDSVPDSGSSGGKGQSALAHKSPPGLQETRTKTSSHWEKIIVIRRGNSHGVNGDM